MPLINVDDKESVSDFINDIAARSAAWGEKTRKAIDELAPDDKKVVLIFKSPLNQIGFEAWFEYGESMGHSKFSCDYFSDLLIWPFIVFKLVTFDVLIDAARRDNVPVDIIDYTETYTKNGTIDLPEGLKSVRIGPVTKSQFYSLLYLHGDWEISPNPPPVSHQILDLNKNF